jgi:hypothetical protein
VTRCLNCGAERSADVCDSCGLNSRLAELALRRRLLNRTAVLLVGALAFVVASSEFPPLELDGILIFVGLLFFLTLGLGMWVERRALAHKELEALKRVYYGLIPVPWLLGALLIANGWLDRAPRESWHTEVIGRVRMFGPLPSNRLVVRSWRDGHRVERVPVSRADFDRFHSSDMVIVKTGEGLVGIPWVTGVDRE